MTAVRGKGKNMNLKGFNSSQSAGNGQQNGYPPAGYPGGMNYPGYASPQGYQAQGYQQTQPSYQGGQGYPPAQGYPAGTGYQQGYQQQGYQTPQVSGAQKPVSPAQESAAVNNGQGFYYQNPYAQQNYPQTGAYTSSSPYAQAGGAQPYPYQGSQNAGYIPQTPPYQGYPPQGYQQTGGYSQGYNAYGQMGRTQQMAGGQPYQETGRQMTGNQMMQDTNRQVPLNGGGYIPQAVPVRRRPFEMTDADLLILSAIMLILFVLGMFIPGLAVLKWFFMILAAGTIALLWIKPLVASNKRLCYTIVFALLMAVTLFRMIYPGGQQASSQQGNDPTRVSSTGQQNLSPGSNSEPVITAVPESTVTNTPEPQDDNSVTERLQTFFYYWSANRQDDMLTLCAPSWQSKVENPKTALFGLMANRTPKEYMVENITGTEYDTSRTVTVVSLMDRNNGKDPVRYRLSVIMLKENDNQWYVDPKSLQTYEAADTPDPSITPTPGPTEEPAIYPNTVLYYNPSGGEFYHLDQNCKRINERYLPLQGHFTYAELGKDPYNKLKPCAICGAPSKE